MSRARQLAIGEHTPATWQALGYGGSDPSMDEAIDRLVAKLDIAEGCWPFTGYVKETGYGMFSLGGKVRLAHRVAYELAVGPIPPGLDIDHLCRNRACCNPDHLEPVSTRVNVLRGESPGAKNAAKTHCPAGHPYTDENTERREGERRCRTCRREWQREQKRRERARKKGVVTT